MRCDERPETTHCCRFPDDRGWTAVDPLRTLDARECLGTGRPASPFFYYDGSTPAACAAIAAYASAGEGARSCRMGARDGRARPSEGQRVASTNRGRYTPIEEGTAVGRIKPSRGAGDKGLDL